MKQERLAPHGVFNDSEFVPDGRGLQQLADMIDAEFRLPPRERPRHGKIHVSHVTTESVAESRVHLPALPGGQRESYSITASSEGIALGKLSVGESAWRPVNGTTEDIAHMVMGRLGYLSPTESPHLN